MKSNKTISAAELARLSGLSTRWLRELGEALPKAKSGSGYLWPEAFKALLDHYRHAAKDARLDPLQQVKKMILEDRLRQSRRELIPAVEVRTECTRTTSAAKARLLAIPGQMTVRFGIGPKAVEAMGELIKDACRELETRWEKA